MLAYMAAQGDEADALHQHAAHHHERHRLARRQHVQQHGAGHRGKREPGESGHDGAGENAQRHE